MKISRNAKCPCGNGKKYKQCHGQKEPLSTSWSKAGILAVGLALTLGVGHGIYAVANAPDANAGKVWSAEHNHWHNADGSELGSVTAATGAAGVPGAPAPQPPGPAPEGKVWSAEHGHWHDAAQ